MLKSKKMLIFAEFFFRIGHIWDISPKKFLQNATSVRNSRILISQIKIRKFKKFTPSLPVHERFH